MARALLVSLRNEDTSKTFSVDELSQSMVWLGLASNVTAENAIAVVLATDEGLVLRPTRNCQLIATRNKTVSEYKLSMAVDTILFIASPKIKTMTRLHIRPVTEGMREYLKLMFTQDVMFMIGRDDACGIRYSSRFV
jgi:hypothetical protein